LGWRKTGAGFSEATGTFGASQFELKTIALPVVEARHSAAIRVATAGNGSQPLKALSRSPDCAARFRRGSGAFRQ
jgi:hypothetical protein